MIVGIVVSYLSVVAWFFGFAIAKYGGGNKEGVRGRVRSILIPLGSHRLHLHHWLICATLILIGVTKSFYLFFPPEIFYGFLAGLVFQGLFSYGDWYRIIHRKPALISDADSASDNNPSL